MTIKNRIMPPKNVKCAPQGSPFGQCELDLPGPFVAFLCSFCPHTMSDTILLDCPKCGRKIGVPGVSGTIHVTCPACKKQWDWPPSKTPTIDAVREATGRLFSGFRGRFVPWCRYTLSRGRFSGVFLVAVTIAGIGIGFLLGDQWAVRSRAGRAAQAATAQIPALPDTADLTATNVPNSAGITPKVGDTVPTNLEDLIPEKPAK